MLVLQNALEIADWTDALQGASKWLIAPLAGFLDDDKRDAVQIGVIARIYGRYAAGLPGAYMLLEKLLDRQIFTKEDVTLAKRQARIAVALLVMGRRERAWELLEHSSDPTVRSFMIEDFRPIGIEFKLLLAGLDQKVNSIRRAILLSLGDKERFSTSEQDELLPRLQQLYINDSDAGIHAAAEWVLGQWQGKKWLSAKNVAWAKDEQKRTLDEKKSGWFVNGQGQTLAIIRDPVEFSMNEDPVLSRMQIKRSYAIASKEVTAHVAAVERAFRVLDALADGSDLGTNEIARRTGIDASTVSRLLATLASARYVEHVAASGRYRLSLRLVELGNAVLGRLDLRALARPHLEALVRVTGETATLSAPAEHDAVTVDFVHGSSAVQSVAQLGRPSIGHATAVGKVMLAFGAVALPADPLAGFTPRTITTRERLVEELGRVRRRGFAEARRSAEEGLAAIAAPVRDSRGELVGIVGLQGTASRFDAKAARGATPLLLDHAESLAAELGWRG